MRILGLPAGRFIAAALAAAGICGLQGGLSLAQQDPPKKPARQQPAKPTGPRAAAAKPAPAPDYSALPPSQIGIGTLAKQAYIIDAASDTVLLFKDADKPMHPSSMAKMMTVYIVFEELKAGRLKLDS